MYHHHHTNQRSSHTQHVNPVRMVLRVLLLLLLAHVALAVEPFPYNPLASPKASVVGARARFTVLTPRLVRMEYSRNGKFEDRASLAFLNRQLPVPDFNVTHESDGALVIRTEYLVVSYNPTRSTNGEFTAASLQVNSTKSLFQWRVGQPNPQQMKGTIRSLDTIKGSISLNCSQVAGVKVHDELLHCELGVISRAGWVVINDTASQLLEDDWPVDDVSSDAHDLYFFGHGHDYRGALADFVKVSGPVPLVPRYVSGIMWTRWYGFTSASLKQVVGDYESRSIPLDVVIIDMDWHLSNCVDLQACQGKKYNFWTGYTFNPFLFPSPSDTLGWMHDKGLHMSINLHDDAGVQAFEERYSVMAKANGVTAPNTVAMDITNKTYAYSLEDLVLKPLEDAGIDFMWIDWQQGNPLKHAPQMNPTIWLNKLRASDPKRRGENKRPLVLARYGGLGNQRYQVGFSGDVDHCWESLAFQPYFSSRGSNVAYGMWSHDIRGESTDYELSTRWVQWGAWSAIYRTHDAGASAGGCMVDGTCSPVSIWKTPTRNFEASRAAVFGRSELLPYIYTQSYHAFATGECIIRPMYYDWPEEDLAYSEDLSGQYMFGDTFLVSPVTQAADGNTSMTLWSTWFPEGEWYGWQSGLIVSSGSPLVPSGVSPKTIESSVCASAEADRKACPVSSGESNRTACLTAGCCWWELVSSPSVPKCSARVAVSDKSVRTNYQDLTDIPVYARAGSVVFSLALERNGGAKLVGTAQQQYKQLEVSIVPGAACGSAWIYEDDGVTNDFDTSKAFANTTASYVRSGSSFALKLGTQGSYAGMETSRTYFVRLLSTLPPKTVTVDGVAAKYVRHGIRSVSTVSWTYDGDALAVVIACPGVSTDKTLSVSAELNTLGDNEMQMLSGVRGAIRHALLAKDLLDQIRVNRYERRALSVVAESGDQWGYLAGTNVEELIAQVKDFGKTFQAAVEQVDALQNVDPTWWSHAKTLLASVWRG